MLLPHLWVQFPVRVSGYVACSLLSCANHCGGGVLTAHTIDKEQHKRNRTQMYTDNSPDAPCLFLLQIVSLPVSNLLIPCGCFLI